MSQALLYDQIKTPLGVLFLGVSQDGIVRACFQRNIGQTVAELEALGYEVQKRGTAGKSKSDRLFEQAESALGKYFAGVPKALDAIPISIAGTEFQQQVWKSLRRIGPGKTMSYSSLAAKIGRERAARAVGNACKNNPVVLFVPCHRVIGKDQSLTGFAAGLNRKEFLLEHEAQHLS